MTLIAGGGGSLPELQWPNGRLTPKMKVLRNAFRSALWPLVVMSCDDAPRHENSPANDAPAPAAAQRTFTPVVWDTVFTVSGQIQDTLLLIPRLLRGSHDRLYVYDYGDSQLKAFDSSGSLLWRIGRQGVGPGEFRNPVDAEVAPDGTIWLLDGGAGRLTTVSPQGDFRSVVPLRGRTARDVIPLEDEVLLTPISPENAAWMSLSSSGELVAQGPYPLAEQRNAFFPRRQTIATNAQNGKTWAAVYFFGKTLVVYDGRELRCHGTLVEGQTLPTEPPTDSADPTIWAAGIFFDDNRVMVLARGTTDGALRMLDEYSSSDCKYVRSVRLPLKVVAAAKTGDTYAFAYLDPAPGVIGLKRKDLIGVE
ncbi:MAG: 6-bladed beta-propeller [Gemmatimonadota bacterium]